jgi:hypothetical protein
MNRLFQRRAMIRRPRPVDSQDACLLFTRLPAELRNHIYTFVFALETSDDGSIKLDGATKPPSKALFMTCRRLHNETRAMYRAAYRSFPDHTFTVDMSIRTVKPETPLSIGNDLLSRINSFRITWSNEHKKAGPLHFTTYIDRDAPRQKFRTRVARRGGDDNVDAFTGRVVSSVIRGYADIALTAMETFNGVRPGPALNGLLAWKILCAVWDPGWEQLRGFCKEVEVRREGSS